MNESEYNRLKKAYEIKSDIELLRDAIAVLRKQPMMFHRLYNDEAEIVRMAVRRFIKDEDMAMMLSQKLDAIEMEYAKL